MGSASGCTGEYSKARAAYPFASSIFCGRMSFQYSVKRVSPFLIFSPVFLCNIQPAPKSILSVFLSRPAPSSLQAFAIFKASSFAIYPSFSAFSSNLFQH